MRKIDTDLLHDYRGQPCQCCGSTETTAHHLKSKGSGGDDAWYNLIPLCFLHHREVHDRGLNCFVDKYTLETYLIDRGWTYDIFLAKWIRQLED